MKILKDPKLRRKLWADITQYYQRDLEDFRKPGSGMTLLWLVTHTYELPLEARIMHHYSEGAYTRQEEMIGTSLDILAQVAYWTRAVAAAKYGKDFMALQNKAPKPHKRPNEKKKKFATPAELQAVYAARKARRKQKQEEASLNVD